MQPAIDAKRLAKVTTLYKGSHDGASKQMCAMEAVAFVAREPWSDHPECACPVISAFVRAWNDGLNDEDRNALILPYVPRLVGTRSTKAVEQRRAIMAADWLVRTHTPAWLRLAGMTDHADALASLPEITDMAQVPSIKPAIEAARKDADAAAWDVARAAAGAAALDAAWDAARAAALAAAWDVARAAAGAAARDAALDAALDAAGAAALDAALAAALDVARAAAGDAAWDAAWDAAGAKLKPTVERLKLSAKSLLDRMLEAA